MIKNAPSVNSSAGVATPFGKFEDVSRHLTTDQSAAMDAALLIGAQYSRESKSQFRRECLDYLRAFLAAAQDVPA
ncbi:hypothetical protein [Pseudomonas reactans]